MRTQLAGLTTLALGLAVGLGASAQTKDTDKDKGTARHMTVHGVIASVTVEGELAIDYKAKKAVEAEMTFLTIIGSPRGERRDGDNAARNNDREARKDNREARKGDREARKGDREAGNRDNRRAERRRHNVYVVWLTPRTQFRDAEAGDNKDKSKDNALTLDDLEVGDRVEVTFNVRDETNTGGQNQTEEIRRKHGRHRTYFGDATSISLLAEPGADRDRNRDNADRDRNRDNQNKDQAKEKK